MSKKIELAKNPSINQFVEQDFPVVEYELFDKLYKRVKVIELLDSHKTFECSYFKVQVIKDYDGFVSFVVIGEAFHTEYGYDVWIMRTDDFNRAYDLKNRLDTLVGKIPNKEMQMPCYGSLQREKTMWER